MANISKYSDSTEQEVAQAWIDGRSARNGSFTTDGETLFSYSLPIGYTFTGFRAHKIIIKYKVSKATSDHVDLVIGLSQFERAEVMTVREWQKSVWQSVANGAIGPVGKAEYLTGVIGGGWGY